MHLQSGWCPLLGGLLLSLGFRPNNMFVAAAIPGFLATLLMAMLGCGKTAGVSPDVKSHTIQCSLGFSADPAGGESAT
jgi:hypothetical protein